MAAALLDKGTYLVRTPKSKIKSVLRTNRESKRSDREHLIEFADDTIDIIEVEVSNQLDAKQQPKEADDIPGVADLGPAVSRDFTQMTFSPLYSETKHSFSSQNVSSSTTPENRYQKMNGQKYTKKKKKKGVCTVNVPYAIFL